MLVISYHVSCHVLHVIACPMSYSDISYHIHMSYHCISSEVNLLRESNKRLEQRCGLYRGIILRTEKGRRLLEAVGESGKL